MSIDSSQIGIPMPLTPRSSQTAPITSPQKKSHRSSGNPNILQSAIPGAVKLTKPAIDGTSNPPDVSANKPPRKRTVSKASMTPSTKSPIIEWAASAQGHNDPSSTTSLAPTPPPKCDIRRHLPVTSIKPVHKHSISKAETVEISSSSIPHQASSSPPSSRPPTPPPKDYVGGIVAPSTRKCSCKTSKAEITVSHEGRSPQASGSLGTEHRIPKRSGPSKVVWLVNKPASQSAVLSPFVEAALLEHRVNRYPWQRTIDSSKARLSMGTDISLDIYGPSLAYLAVSEAFQGHQPLEIARHGYHFVHALRTSFEKTEKLLDVGKLSPTCVNSKRCLQGTFYILSLFMNNFNHGRLPYGSKKSPTPQERALTRSEKEALKSFLDAYHGLLDELWADFKAYLRALEQERKKQCSGGNEKPVLKPDEEYLLAEIKKLKLSGVKLKAILDSLMKFACTSSETVVNKLKKTVASEDATSFGSGTLASLRSIGLTSSTTLASSSNDSRVDISSDDDNFVTLRKSVIILDGLYPDLGITAETSLNRFPNIWDDNMATLGSIISELTDPLKANIESTCVLFDTFFLFFHEFADPENLLDVLKARFVQKQPHNGNASLQEDFETLHRHVQHRVIKLVNLWVRFHWYEARDGSIRHSLYEFLHGLVRNPDDCYFSITILELLPLVIQSDTSITLGRFKEASDLQDDAVVYAPTGFDNAYNLEHHKTLLTAVDINFFAVEGGCEELARAFTLIESDYFHSFLPGDITMWCTKKKGSAMEKWDTFTNSLMLWIPTTILNQRDDFYRARSIMFWIQTAVYCKDLRNYSTSLSITLALQLSAITRLKKTINLLPKEILPMHASLLKFFVEKKNDWAEYRHDLGRPYPAVPLPAVIKADIIKLGEKYPKTHGSAVDELSGKIAPTIGFQFYRKLRGTISDVERCYPYAYTFPKIDIVRDWIIANQSKYVKYLDRNKHETFMTNLYTKSKYIEPEDD